MYKYTPGQHFGPHYDDSVRDAVTGDRSEWTLLVYLTGVQDGVEGGEVGTVIKGYVKACVDAWTDLVLQAAAGQAQRDHHAAAHSWDSSSSQVIPHIPEHHSVTYASAGTAMNVFYTKARQS